MPFWVFPSLFQEKYNLELYIVFLNLNPMSKKSNQKADVKNPNNPAYKAAQDNTSNQLNPNHLASKSTSVATEATDKGTKSK